MGRLSKATVIKEYDYDEEFKHLGYSASLVGGSFTATAGMLKTVRRTARSVLQRKPSASFRHCVWRQHYNQRTSTEACVRAGLL